MITIFKYLLFFTAILTVWFGVAASAGAYGQFDTLAVPFAREGFHKNLSSEVSIVDVRGGMFIYRGDKETLVQNLQEAGALFIMPARTKTCLDLQKPSA